MRTAPPWDVAEARAPTSVRIQSRSATSQTRYPGISNKRLRASLCHFAHWHSLRLTLPSASSQTRTRHEHESGVIGVKRQLIYQRVTYPFRIAQPNRSVCRKPRLHRIPRDLGHYACGVSYSRCGLASQSSQSRFPLRTVLFFCEWPLHVKMSRQTAFLLWRGSRTISRNSPSARPTRSSSFPLRSFATGGWQPKLSPGGRGIVIGGVPHV